MKRLLKFVIMDTMGDNMNFLITLDQFEGPLDLMLHLIKENKLDKGVQHSLFLKITTGI